MYMHTHTHTHTQHNTTQHNTNIIVKTIDLGLFPVLHSFLLNIFAGKVPGLQYTGKVRSTERAWEETSRNIGSKQD